MPSCHGGLCVPFLFLSIDHKIPHEGLLRVRRMNIKTHKHAQKFNNECQYALNIVQNEVTVFVH